MKKIYISGCGGGLGDAFYKQFKDGYELKCSDIDVNDWWLDYCDIRDSKEYLYHVEKFNPDYLFHLGAMTDLEDCERNPSEAVETNAKAVKNAVDIANLLDIPLLYIGTAGIFDGKKDFYGEDDKPSPLCVYARTKFAGESTVLKMARKPLVCRASWMVGGGEKDKGFVQIILKKIKSGEKTLHVVNDKRGTITYTHDFAKNVRLLIEGGHTGLFHVANIGNTDRLEMAKQMISILELEEEIEIKGVSSDYFKEKYHAARPECECLINNRLNRLGLNIMQHWKVALKEYLKDFHG